MDGRLGTCRHNRTSFNYSIICLCVSSRTISGIEIDTAFLKDNEAPAISGEGCFSTADEEVMG